MISRFLLATICLLSIASVRAADPTPKPEPVKTLQSTDTVGIKAMLGQYCAVEGKVLRVGTTKHGYITFLNMAPGPASFVGVIFKPNYGEFPKGFDQYKGKTLRLTGKIEIYSEATPEIVLKSADQLEVIESSN